MASISATPTGGSTGLGFLVEIELVLLLLVLALALIPGSVLPESAGQIIDERRTTLVAIAGAVFVGVGVGLLISGHG